MTPTDDNHGRNEQPRGRRRALWLAGLGMLLASGLAGTCLAHWLKPPAESQAKAEKLNLKMPANLFRGWGKPDLAIVLTGSQHGYILPCGCSRPQKGGLERRYNFVQTLREQGWSVAAVDVGDIPQLRGPQGLANEQGMLKYIYSMRALKRIGYSAVSFGEYEAGLTLLNAFSEYALQDPAPRVVAANLKDPAENYPEMLTDWIEVKDVPIKTGVTASISPTVADQIARRDAAPKFTGTSESLKRVLGKMDKERMDLRILLYQGYATNHKEPGGARVVSNTAKPEAVRCAEAFPAFQIVLCLTEEDEPSGEPMWVNGNSTMIASLGHKGKYVGVVGVWKPARPGAPFTLKYQLVEMSEEFLTPKDKEVDHPIVKMMEDYTEQLKRDDYLARFALRQTKHPLQVMEPIAGLKGGKSPTYIGSEACKKCHKEAYDIWKKTPHSHAYQTLVDAKRPSLRQFDAECIVCHTTGFGYQTGFTNEEATPKLKNVGCESCHGPGSIHAANSRDETWQERMNPWKAPADENAAAKAKRLARVDHFCQGCHDIDNDVTWTHNGFDKKWPKIAHPSGEPEKKTEK